MTSFSILPSLTKREISPEIIEYSMTATEDPSLLLALATWIEQHASEQPLAQIRWTWRTPEGEVVETWAPTPGEMETALADLSDRLDAMVNPVGVRTTIFDRRQLA